MGWIREAKKRQEAEASAIATLKRENLPFAGEKIRGLWWVEGEDGYFVEHASGRRVFDAGGRRVVCVQPIAGDELDSLLAKADLGANLAWACVNTCGACGRVIRDCHCNDYPEF